MFIPKWVLIAVGSIILLFVVWAGLAVNGKNPLPFPDPGSRIFAAKSDEGKEAIVALLRMHGLNERFQMDSSGIKRSIMMDGTIINVSPAYTVEQLDGATSAIGLVAEDPEAAAEKAAIFLKERGFRARVVKEVEPNLPIAFVVTDAMAGTAINFRKHVTQMPQPQ